LAKCFRVQVSQSFKARETYHRAGSKPADESIDVRETTRSRAQASLEGVSIAERHRDGRHYCSLAILNKPEATKRAREELLAVEKRLDKTVAAQAVMTDLIKKVAAWGEIVALGRRGEELWGRLSILGATPPARTGLGTVEAVRRRAEFLADVAVRLQVTGAQSARIRAALAERLAQCSIPTTEADDAGLVVNVDLNISPGSRVGGDYVWIRYEFALQAVNPVSGATLVVTASNDEVGHTSSDKAENRAVSTVEAGALPEFSEKLCSWWNDFVKVPDMTGVYSEENEKD